MPPYSTPFGNFPAAGDTKLFWDRRFVKMPCSKSQVYSPRRMGLKRETRRAWKILAAN